MNDQDLYNIAVAVACVAVIPVALRLRRIVVGAKDQDVDVSDRVSVYNLMRQVRVGRLFLKILICSVFGMLVYEALLLWPLIITAGALFAMFVTIYLARNKRQSAATDSISMENTIVGVFIIFLVGFYVYLDLVE